MKKIDIKKIVHNIFSKRITVFKWQLNLFALICTLSGLLIGTFFGIKNILRLFAANDTVQTWVFNNSTLSGYTYDNTLIQGTSNSITGGINRITNGTFNSDTSSWNGIQSYILDDEFSDTQPTTLVSGVSTLTNGGVITPVTGNEINGDVGFDNSSYWTLGTNATVVGSKLNFSTTPTGASKANMLNTNTWYRVAFDLEAVSSGAQIYISGHNPDTFYSTAGQIISTYRSVGLAISVNSNNIATATIDNYSVKALNLSSLFSLVNTSSNNVAVSTGVTLTKGTVSGIVVNLDNATNPQNFVIAYHDGINAHLEKCVNGTYTSLINAAATYAAGAVIKITRDSSGYSLFYNGTQVGTTQNITDTSIINNTIHGLFSTYASNSFTNFLITNTVNGTSSTPILAGNGSDIRTVKDTTSKLSISSGSLSLVGGLSTPVAGDPGIWYPSTARIAGKLLVANLTLSGYNTGYFGFDNNQQGGIYDFFCYSGSAMITSGCSVNAGNITPGGTYQYALVLRSTGTFYFIKGGTQYPNWTLLYIDSIHNNASMYPSLSGYNLATTMDYLRIPTQTYLPTPIAYDTFTRSNGLLGNTEITGPDSQTTSSLIWNNLGTWTISSSGAINTPTVGNEMVLNGSVESGTTNWSTPSGATLSAVADQRTGGTGTQSLSGIRGSSNNNVAQQNVNLQNGGWYTLGAYLKNVTSVTAMVNLYCGTTLMVPKTTSLSWANVIGTTRVPQSSCQIVPCVENASGLEARFDDISLKLLSLSSLFSTVSTSTPAVVESTNITMTNGTQAGLVTNLDSYDNPQNFLVAYTDGTNVHLDKAVSDNATLTNLVTNGGFETSPYSPHNGWSEAGVVSDETNFVHSGSHAAKLTNNSSLTQFIAAQATSLTYNLSFWARGDGTYLPRFAIWDGTNSAYIVATTSIGGLTEYKKYTITFTIPAGVRVSLNLYTGSSVSSVAYFDDVSLITVPNITYTSLINTAATYSAGAPLTVITDNSTTGHLKVRVYYNNALIGTEQDITDVGIINNTNHGLFSTYSGNVLDNFTLFPRGTNGEYNGIPAEDITATYDTGIKYQGGGSSKLVSAGNDANYLQTINLGDTNTYQVITYAYTNGSEVTTNDLNLYYNGNIVPTTFTPTSTTGWYKLTGTITGVASDTSIGVRVKANKTVYIDEFSTYKTGLPYIYTTTAYSNTQMVTLDSFNADITTPGSSNVTFQLCADNGTTCESSATWQYWDGSHWVVATNMSTNTNTKAQLTPTVMQSFPTVNKKVSVKAILTLDGSNIPTVSNIAVGMTTDVTPPTSGTNPVFDIRDGQECTYDDNCWTNQTTPKFSWNSGTDDNTGVRGYCLYLGTDESGNPAASKGKLGTSPESLGNSTCQFIVANPNIDLSTAGYLLSQLSNTENFVTQANTYYLNIKAVDRADNVATNSITIRFRYDGTKPNNVSYISTPSGNFSNVVDMSFTWPLTATDSESSVLGYQYQINSNTGTWKGITHSDTLNLDYIPLDQTKYTLTESDASSIISGNNVIYFRSIDIVGNASAYVSGGISFGGQAPQFATDANVTITPNTSTTNNFAISWPNATPSIGSNISHYYYMVNTQPGSTLATLQSNNSTYIDNGTNTTVDTTSLPNVNKGTNTIYVVAVDDAQTPNYSPSSYITGTFTLNSNNPDNVGNLVASDSSIKSQSKWNVTLTYTEPEYKGAGNLTYQIMRSANGTDYTMVGTSTGVSYVDSAPSSSKYYYKIYTKDGANAVSSGSNAVEITPTGRWTTPAELVTQPEISNITPKKATITWTTGRTADSKVAFGTKSLEYFTEEPSNSSQVTGHTINLSGLNPSTTYYYVTKWTDEDGNTGTSQEQSFQTAPAPTVKNVTVSGVGLSSAMIQFTSNGSSKVKIYYGTTTSFGGTQEIYTSSEETKYTIQLTDLNDGSKYYYKINTFDSDMNEYEGTVLDFTTMPRPKISNVTLQEAEGTAQTTILVTWYTNTDITSVVSYYPQGKASESLDSVNVTMTSGKHQMTIKGLLPQTNYILTVKGVDRIGNMATSDSQTFTTATDTRPPVISSLTIQGQIISSTSSSDTSTAQLVISWNTDEPATSQVELGVGSGSSYSQKSQQDSNLTYNHTVVISGLVPSTVYHLRAISLDSVGNTGTSVDTVTISPKATSSALNLVISNLTDIFGFLRK